MQVQALNHPQVKASWGKSCPPNPRDWNDSNVDMVEGKELVNFYFKSSS